MDAGKTFAEFVARWVKSTPPPKDAATAFASVEQAASVTLPAAYKAFVSKYGTPSTTIELLDAIVAGKHAIADVQEFLEVEKLPELTAMYESGGMDPGFLGFASDCMGNMFLFRRADCVPGVEDAPVWFFDHDFVTVEEEAPSFVEWLARYLEIRREG